jgi:two-component system CheB/CheR fusion protein
MDEISGQSANPQPGGRAQPSMIDFPVVGIGASAGGLQALLRLFEQMPATSGMAFVVVLHLSPKHESNAAAILQNATRMAVTQVTETVAIEPNHVYVIPPSKHLVMSDGHLRLSEQGRSRGRHVSIDLFFRTLAEAHRHRAFCVILSGTGADGTVGLKRVKEEGGITIAQSPEDAEHDAMPRNAIATGIVDFVLPAVEIPQKLLQVWGNATSIKLPIEETADSPHTADRAAAAEEALRDVLGLLRARTGHDFTHYKRATVLRRIERRLQVNGLQDLSAYRDFLRGHTEEASALLKDMLISVTNFFRDREAFEALEREALPPLLEGRKADDELRAWVPGCATGEEAYSVAMLLIEYASNLTHPPTIQIFATDIDEEALAVAREGSYPESIITDIPPARLRQFFTKEAGGYCVVKGVREKVLFAKHNLIKEPPFSRLDLIACRNLLIYLNRDVQQQVLDLFHFALRPSGFLFLGSSESVDGESRSFLTVDKKHRIFRATPARGAARVPSLPLGEPAARPPSPPDGARERK